MSLVAVKIKSGNLFSIYAIRENGVCRLLQFFEDMPAGDLARIQRYMDRTKDHGLIRNPEQAKPIGDGLYEWRTYNGARVFYFTDSGKVVVCTNGYIKKKDRLDQTEVNRAKILKLKYFEAKETQTLRFEDGLI